MQLYKNALGWNVISTRILWGEGRNATRFAEGPWCCFGDINYERCLLILGFGCRETQVDLFGECAAVYGAATMVFSPLLAVGGEEVRGSTCSISTHLC